MVVEGQCSRQQKAMITSKDSDSVLDDMSDSIAIASAQFAVICQLTHEFPNMPPERLSAYGFSNSDVEYLTSMMRAFRRLADRYAQVRFDVIDMEGAGLRDHRSSDVNIEACGSEFVAVAALPREVASRWPHALDFVASWLGDRELFLRTGFHSGEAHEAIDLLRHS
jgi:hypothetical protein